MRIITGQAKGTHLKTLEGLATRPTSERVKEAVFSMIQFDIEGRRVLDLFAGSGQMGLEAVSRGAREAVLVDKSHEATRIIRENIDKCKFSSMCTVHRCEYLDFIRRNKGNKFDIIFLDPPYASHFYLPSLTALLEYDLLKSTSLLVCESGEEEIFDGNLRISQKFEVYKVSKYSKTYITILRPIIYGESNG